MTGHAPLVGLWLAVVGVVGFLAVVWVLIGVAVAHAAGPIGVALYFFASLAFGGKTIVEFTTPPVP